jgi:hypothetical protein
MDNGLPQTGLIGSEQALQSGFNAAGQSIEQGLNQATQTLSPYTQGGSGAFDYQAALSGAMGPEAQAQAYANYQQSPGQQYLVDQGERAITRNAAATGGLQGGNVLQELQRHGIGFAAQDFNDSFNRLGSLSSMGLSSASLLGGLQFNAGARVGDYAYGTGQALSGGRTRAGQDIAGAIGNTTSSLANLINQQGTGLSGIEVTASINLANILASAGEGDAAAIAQLQTLLANINSGSAANLGGLPAIGQFYQPPSMLQDLGSMTQGLGSMMSAYPQGGGGTANPQGTSSWPVYNP